MSEVTTIQEGEETPLSIPYDKLRKIYYASKELRRAQNHYWKVRTQDALIDCKQAERKLDRMLAAVDTRQKTLF